MTNSILFVVQNIIQYYTLRPFLFYVKENTRWKMDILVYGFEHTGGFENIAKDVGDTIMADGLTFVKKPTRDYYKICMSPYINMVDIKSKYSLGYCYGSATTKPSKSFVPEFKMSFHGILVYDTYTNALASVYSMSYFVPNLLLDNNIRHRRKTQKDKPTLLYLPTYDDESISDVAAILEKIKTDYRIIIKGHHGIDHLDQSNNDKKSLVHIADEYYDSKYPSQTLFSKADVVLSDNSGAAMDALYLNVPICIAAKSINEQLANIDTLQYKLARDGIIPYTNQITANKIEAILKSALSDEIRKKQSRASGLLFPKKDGNVLDWFLIVNSYMQDVAISPEYRKLHDYYAEKNNATYKKVAFLERENELLKKDNRKLANRLNSLTSSFIFKIYRKLKRS